MWYLKFLFALFCFTTIAIAVPAQNKKFNKALSKQLDSLRDVDQSPLAIQDTDSAAAVFQKIARRNFPMVKTIAAKYGFPGYDLVGKVSSNNYWLLVQHSDFDVTFQKDVLKLMKVEVDKKNASGQSYAYLVDRINLNEGKEQIYGTQVLMGETGTKLKPCIDTANLDKRRLSVGLTPISEYLKQCDDAFHEMNRDKIKMPAKSDSANKDHR